MKKTILSMVIVAAVSSPAYALDAASTQQYCEDVKNAGRNAMKRHVEQRTPKQAPSEMFADSVKSCVENIFSKGAEIYIPGGSAAAIRKSMQELMQEAFNKACQSVTDQFNSAVNDAVSVVNQGFDVYNDFTGMDVGVQTNNKGGVSFGSAGDVSDTIKNQGGHQINNNLNFN